MRPFEQFHWVAVIVINAPENDVYFFEAFHRLNPYESIARHQVITLCQGEAHMRRQKSVFKVRLIARSWCEQNDAWLFALMRNNDEPLEVRTAALSRVASSKMPIADAVKLYGTVADRQMREQLINVYAQRREPEATDKLLDIVKNDTDYNLRSRAINALTRKNDPRANKLLLEIIDK